MDIDYNELFGIDDADVEENTEGDEGVKGQTVAESENEMTDTENVDDSDADDADDTDADDTDASGDAGKQSAEDNKKFAAARRKAEKERDIAVQRAREEARADADRYIGDAIKAMGLKNPYTGKLIETKAELDEYNSKVHENRKNEFLKRTGMSEEEYKSFVDNLPEVARARLDAEKAKSARLDAERTRAKAMLDDEVKKISSLDSSIKSVEDITKSENYPQIYEKVKRGYSLYDAFLSVNHTRLKDINAASARQKALNSISGKEHLTASSERGKGSASVPREIADAYREFNPKATDAEIQKHYDRYLKQKKG